MRESQRELGLEDSVASVSCGRGNDLRGAPEDPGHLREQWTSVRGAGVGDSAGGSDEARGGARSENPLWAQAGRGRAREGARAGRTGRRACGQPGGPPAAGRGPAGLGLLLIQRRFSPLIGCFRRGGAGLGCPEKK